VKYTQTLPLPYLGGREFASNKPLAQEKKVQSSTEKEIIEEKKSGQNTIQSLTNHSMQ